MVFYSKNSFLPSIGFSFLVLFSCKNEKKLSEETVTKSADYTMYQPSEMANFMNAMYTYNQHIKAQIVAGELPSTLSLDLLKLHSAEMSNGKARTQTWQSFVNVFIESQEAIADTLSHVDLKERYNTTIINCLNCHKTECVGPIPKIKKLLIQS